MHVTTRAATARTDDARVAHSKTKAAACAARSERQPQHLQLASKGKMAAAREAATRAATWSLVQLLNLPLLQQHSCNYLVARATDARASSCTRRCCCS
jgi:hypothetical protein